MNAVDRYVNQVKSRIFGSPESVERFEADLRARFEEGLAQGESAAVVVDRLGTPEEVAAAFMADVDFEYAGFFERLFAFFGDAGVCLWVAAPFVVSCGFLAPHLDRIENTFAGFLVIGALVAVGLFLAGVFLLYFPLLESHFGRTVGKRLMRIQVRTEEGARIGLGAAFLRRLSFYFEILALDALFVPFTAKKQRAFDIVARTIVVRDPGSRRGVGPFLLCAGLFVAPLLVIGLFGLFVFS